MLSPPLPRHSSHSRHWLEIKDPPTLEYKFFFGERDGGGEGWEGKGRGEGGRLKKKTNDTLFLGNAILHKRLLDIIERDDDGKDLGQGLVQLSLLGRGGELDFLV